MKIISSISPALLLATLLVPAASSNNQVPLAQTLVPELQFGDIPTLSTQNFVRFSHPYFPYHSARIKKTEGFCDETVKWVSSGVRMGPFIRSRTYSMLGLAPIRDISMLGRATCSFTSSRAGMILIQTMSCYGQTGVSAPL